MIALEVRDLDVPFGDAPGLAGVSFSVRPGERVALVGPSGVGKTTLLRAVAGLSPVRAGAVRIDGRDVTAADPEARGAVYLHQAPVLFPHLDVFGNVAFPLRVRGTPERNVRERVHDVLARVRMEGYERRPVRALSGGQRHRVALARAIAARPPVLLLDEPLAALDPALREEVREAIVAVQERDRPALVLVTHDIDEAGILADRVGVVLDGSLAQLDAPRDLFDRPASLAVARFLGFPNLIEGTVDAQGRFVSPVGSLVPPGPGLAPGPATAAFLQDAVIPDPNGIAGRVVSWRHRLRGSTVVVRAGIDTLEMAEPGPGLRIGDEVRFRIDPDRAVVFPTPPA